MIQARATNVNPNTATIPLFNATFLIYLPEARVDAGGGKSCLPCDRVTLNGSSGLASPAQIEMAAVGRHRAARLALCQYPSFLSGMTCCKAADRSAISDPVIRGLQSGPKGATL
jgi:hypothetical protein